MTGSLQEKKRYWYTVIYYSTADGKGQYKWKSTGLEVKNNKKRAEQILRQRIEEAEKKSVLQDKDILFADFMKEWLLVIKAQVRPNTHHQYSLLIENSIAPFFVKMKVKLQDLQPIHIQRYYNQKVADGLSGSTIRRHHANIHKALNYAVKTNWIPYNPADRVELPKAVPFMGNFYTADQIKLIFELVTETYIETAVLLAVTYGLRRSEAVGLKWDAIDFENHRLIIRHTVVGNGKRQFAPIPPRQPPAPAHCIWCPVLKRICAGCGRSRAKGGCCWGTAMWIVAMCAQGKTAGC